MLGPRAKTESAGPGQQPRRYWEGKDQRPWHRGAVETTALAALAFARARPQAAELDGGHRLAPGPPHRRPAGSRTRPRARPLAALAAFYGKAEAGRGPLSPGRHRQRRRGLPRRGRRPGRGQGHPRAPQGAQGRRHEPRPLRHRGPGHVRLRRDPDRLHPRLRPRPGPTANRPFVIGRASTCRPTPSSTARPCRPASAWRSTPHDFENTVTQVAARRPGPRRDRRLARTSRPASPAWERDFLVVEEHLPAGTTLVEGSVQTAGQLTTTLADGVLTFYFAPDQYPGTDPLRRLRLPARPVPGPARRGSAAPTSPAGRTSGRPATLPVLAPGEPRDRPLQGHARRALRPRQGPLRRRPARRGRRAAGGALRRLHPPRRRRQGRRADAPDRPHQGLPARARSSSTSRSSRRRRPELVIPFDQILVVGRAYRDIGEHERAYLVWRAIAEASYLEDAQVGEVLRQRGQTLEAIAFLLDLWREYPDTASIESDFFGLSQVLASLAGQAIDRPGPPPASWPTAGVTRSDLLLQSIRLIQVFLAPVAHGTPWPTRRAWPWSAASWSWRTTRRSSSSRARFAELYPKSTFLDSFQYSEALGRFHLGQYDRAIEVAEAIAKATYKDANGVDQPSPNKWQAIYILGQIHDARRQPAKAVELLPAGRRPVHRRGRRRQGADPQGAEAARGLGRPPRGGPEGRGRAASALRAVAPGDARGRRSRR